MTNSKSSAFANKPYRPRWLTERDYTQSEGPIIKDFAESQCVIVKESISGNVGDPIRIRDWQEALLNDLFALDDEGNRIHRTALIGISRKNGKSAWAACLALYEFVFGPEGGEILIVASSRDQAKIIWTSILQMLRRNPNFEGLFHKNRDTLENTKTGTTLRALSSREDALEGLSGSFIIVDEVHVVSEKIWSVLQESKGARKNPMLIGITTAGSKTTNLGTPTLCYRLYEHGKKICTGEVEDDSFFFAWWEPLEGDHADHTDPETWRQANPGLGDLVSIESFEDSLPRTPEPEFRTKRCNQWVQSMDSALPTGMWEKYATDDRLQLDDKIQLAYDGAWSNDASALIAVRIEDLLVQPIHIWEKQDDPDWRMDTDEVLDTIRLTTAQYEVVELAYDKAYWGLTFQTLEKEGINTIEIPQSSARHAQHWEEFYRSLGEGELKHTDDPVLNRHLENMVLKRTPIGDYPTKPARNSNKKIDAGMATIWAVNRALWHQQNVSQPRTWLAV